MERTKILLDSIGGARLYGVEVLHRYLQVGCVPPGVLGEKKGRNFQERRKIPGTVLAKTKFKGDMTTTRQARTRKTDKRRRKRKMVEGRRGKKRRSVGRGG